MVVVDEETADLLIEIGEAVGYHHPEYQKLLDYIFSGLHLKKYPWGRRGGFSDEELKKWLRSISANRVKARKAMLFMAYCPNPKCKAKWLQGPRHSDEEYVECPECHIKIHDPEILGSIPLKEDFPHSLDELSEEQKSQLPDEVKEMIAFNEGYRYGEARGTFDEKEEWLKRYYVREEKHGWERERTVEVPVSEAEIIKKLKWERGLSAEETLVAVPKFRSLKNNEEMLLAVLFSIKEGTPLTQYQLANILHVTQPRISQLLIKYEGKLIKAIRIENPKSNHKRRHLQGYYMPQEVKEKLAKTLLPTNMFFKHVRPLAEKHPELAWRESVLS